MGPGLTRRPGRGGWTVRKLEGRVAVVSGGGRGIGRAIAVKLAGEGARVVVNDLDPGPAEETVGALRALGAEAVACPGSVTDPGFGERLVGAALDAFGGLHILVNNAGYTWDGVIQKMGDEQWQAMLDVHLTAPFRILRAAAPYLRDAAQREAQEGREVYRKVVNISSIAGLGGNAGQANYAAAKAGVVGLTKTLAKEWGRYRVNVNVVAFGLIQTRLTRPLGAGEAGIEDVGGREVRLGVPAEAVASWEKAIPLGRAGTPEEAAGAVYLLCAPESDYITGEVLLCAGGLGF
ncbi:MAG: SDR family NAD(P)-dependent oxidoreductase [Deferrisomatales bacterium]